MLNETIKPEVIGTNSEIKFENYDWIDVGIFTTTPVEPEPEPVVTPYARWQFDEFSTAPQTIVNTATPASPYTANWTSGYSGYEEGEVPLSWGGLEEFYDLDKGGYCSIPFNYSNNFSISVAGHCFDSNPYPQSETVSCALLNITGLNLVVNCLTRDPDSVSLDETDIRLFAKLGKSTATYLAGDVTSTGTASRPEYKMDAWNYNSDFNVSIEKDTESIALKVNGVVKIKWDTPAYTGDTNAVIGNNTYYLSSSFISFFANYSSFNIDYIE